MNLPNWITIFRILSIPFIVAMLIKYRLTHIDYYKFYGIALFAAASISDAVDGAIARIAKKKTRLGTLLDPLADKLLLVSVVLALGFPVSGFIQLPIWVIITFISRDILLIIGAVFVYIFNQNLIIKPNLLGKITTFLQMLTVIWVMFQFPMPYLLWRTAGFFTIVSGMVYLYQGSKQLNHNSTVYCKCE